MNAERWLVWFVGASLAGLPAGWGASVESLLQRTDVQQALEQIELREAQLIEEQIRIAEIPAPSFAEEERAQYLLGRFRDLGLAQVRLDGVGNVLGEYSGSPSGSLVVVAAHLDTVFNAETKLEVRREGSRLHGPGIADNSRGLAVMLGIIETLGRNALATEHRILFVADVGEEGSGDLRGMRHLFSEELKQPVVGFVALDSGGNAVTTQAVGSFRYRVTFRGPGGHSFWAFGLPNPIHAMGRAIEKVSRFKVPTDPKTTFNIGRVEGGTSVNSIPFVVSMEVDLRSVSAQELARLDERFKQAVEEAVREETEFWKGSARVGAQIELIGNRPAGQQDNGSFIVQAAVQASEAVGLEPKISAASTDANVPISLGIPAIHLGCGGTPDGMHSLRESFDTKESYRGTQRALLTLLAVAEPGP